MKSAAPLGPWLHTLVIASITVAISAGVASSALGANVTPDPKRESSRSEGLPADLTGDADESVLRSQISAALGQFDQFNGGSLWDRKSQTMTIQMTSDSALSGSKLIVDRLNPTFSVQFVRVEYSSHELQRLADDLLTNQKKWFGFAGYGGGFDPVKNRVLIEVTNENPDAAAMAAKVDALRDPRIRLEVVDVVPGGGPQSRLNDFAPWTGGASIDSTAGGCTLGWAWRLWSTSEVVASTARHCAALEWYNNGRYVGTVFQSSQGTDSALMRNGGSYSPTVFVGSQNTTEIRNVVGVASSWQYGDSVAMSGRSSGLTVSQILLPTYTLPSCSGQYAGLTGVMMQDRFTLGGDSGGPWLSTFTNGDVLAHGQHFGLGCATGRTGSFFIKLNAISAAQSASLIVN